MSAVPTARSCTSDEPRLLPRNRFLGHGSDPPLSTPDFATPIGVLSARHRIDPSKHLAKEPPVQMSLRQQQPLVPGVLDQSPASLPDPLLQARQGPGVNSLRQHQTAPQVDQVI